MSVSATDTRRHQHSLTVPKPTIYWRETEPVEAGEALQGAVRCDVCIVGGGYTGLWTAHHLKRADPSLEIHLVEADYAGAGASGHNDGFITPTIGHSLWTLVHRFGVEASRTAYASVGRSIVEIQRFCRQQGLERDHEPNGFYLVATSPAQMRRLEVDLSLAEQMGARGATDLLLGEDARARVGSPAILGALQGGGALVNPHRLVRALARVVGEEGVQVHERTPALEIERVTGGHRITTPQGSVSAERVVLATNAYQHRFRAFHRQVKPVWSYAAVSEPLSARRLAEVHWPGREGFVEARNFILFARLTAEDRLLLGGGPAPYFYGSDMDQRHVRNPSITVVLREALARFFPPWRDLRFTHAYGGCIAVTRDLVPHVGEQSNGLIYGYGYCGNGIAMSHTAGKAMRDLVLGRESGYSKLLFVNGREPSFPAEPIGYLAARGLSRALQFQDRHPSLIRRQLI